MAATREDVSTSAENRVMPVRILSWFDDVVQPGDDPDPRFSFANERTFLAWIRTALALVAGGLAANELLPPFEDAPNGRALLGVPLLVLGGVVAVAAYSRWAGNERALRLGTPLPSTRLLLVVASSVGAIALAATVLVVVG